MSARLRAAAAVLLAGLLVAGSPAAALADDGAATPPTSAPAGPTPDPTPTPTPVPGDAEEAVPVTDAQFRWGINPESGNAAYAPGTVNLLSAGRIPSTGPSQPLTEDRWSASSGDVRIEKRQADGSSALATWAGTRTTPGGQPLTSPTAGLYSQHEVVIDGGTGTVDAAAGTAEIRWDGDFSVVLYSGLTFSYVSDPALHVADGRAEVTAVLGGYATDMGGTRWDPLPETEVVLARFSAVGLGPLGLTGTPDYLGVAYDPPAGGGWAPQTRTGDSWGAFPADFVDYQIALGQGPYWYSTGSATDRSKMPLPLTVSFDAERPLPPPEPVAEPASPPPVPGNPVREPPPRAAPPPSPAPAPASPAAPAVRRAAPPVPVAAPVAAPPPTGSPPAGEWQAFPSTVAVAAERDLAGLLPRTDTGDLGWWLGSAGLLLVSLIVRLASTGRLALPQNRL